jgi:hypothetical protein
MKTLTKATAVAVLTLTLAACGVSKAEEVSPPSTEAPAPTDASTTSTTVEATTTTTIPTDDDLNLLWAPQAIADSEAMVSVFTEISEAAGTYDQSATAAACAKLIPVAQSYATNAPDTEAGRHAKAAADLYVRAAEACIEGDLDAAIAFMSAGGSEVDLATAAL